jgi:hypothetical protein
METIEDMESLGALLADDFQMASSPFQGEWRGNNYAQESVGEQQRCRSATVCSPLIVTGHSGLPVAPERSNGSALAKWESEAQPVLKPSGRLSRRWTVPSGSQLPRSGTRGLGCWNGSNSLRRSGQIIVRMLAREAGKDGRPATFLAIIVSSPFQGHP